MTGRSLASTLLIVFALPLAGCGSVSGWTTQSAAEGFVDGTRILGEAIMLPTRAEALSDRGMFTGWKSKMVTAGYAESDIVDGGQVSIWAYCYGWNSGVDICAHHGHYVAFVPPAIRGQITAALADGSGGTGDLLEVELRRNAQGFLVGSVVSVYRESTDWSPCRLERLRPTSEAGATLMTLGGVGPPQAIWIECVNVEADGWRRRMLTGVPSSAGPPISEWVKLPD